MRRPAARCAPSAAPRSRRRARGATGRAQQARGEVGGTADECMMQVGHAPAIIAHRERTLRMRIARRRRTRRRRTGGRRAVCAGSRGARLGPLGHATRIRVLGRPEGARQRRARRMSDSLRASSGACRAARITRRTSDQKLRWCAAALLQLEPRLRRIKGCEQLPLLQAALRYKLQLAKPAVA
jgi:hypothetical protein